MSNDAGFAAAVTIRQQLLQAKLRATYANGQFPRRLDVALPDGPPAAKIAFFLGEPDIGCEGATNLLVITLPVWGGVTVTLGGQVTVQVKGRIEVTIVPDFQRVEGDDSKQYAQLNPLTTIAVRNWAGVVTSADPPPEVAGYVTGDAFRGRLQTAIVTAVLLGKIALPRIPIDYLNGVPAFVAENAVASVVVEGALLLGFAVGDDSPTGPIQGDVSALTDFAGWFDLAAFVNPLAARLFFSDVESGLSRAAASQSATLDTGAFRIMSGDGLAHVTGKLDATGGTLNFSFDVIPNLANYNGPGAQWVAYTREHWVDDPHPRIVKPRRWPALWFTTANAHSDIDASWWIDLIDVLTLGFSLLYFLPKFSNSESNFDNKVNNHPPSAPYPRVTNSTPPAGGIALRVALDSFDLRPDGISVGVSVRAKPSTMAVTGPATIPSTYASEQLQYKLRLPSGALPADPTLRIAWSLIDTESETVLASQDDKVGDSSPTFAFQPSAFASSSHFNIQGRLYRLFGTDAEDVGTAVTSLEVRGALAPGAYVSWRAQSVKPRVAFDTTTGQWEYGGDAHVQRHSKWHRTDAPCQAASKGVNYAGRYQPRYADTLPFPLDKLDQFRVVLCDYCFFGGPSGTNARF